MSWHYNEVNTKSERLLVYPRPQWINSLFQKATHSDVSVVSTRKAKQEAIHDTRHNVLAGNVLSDMGFPP